MKIFSDLGRVFTRTGFFESLPAKSSILPFVVIVAVHKRHYLEDLCQKRTITPWEHKHSKMLADRLKGFFQLL